MGSAFSKLHAVSQPRVLGPVTVRTAQCWDTTSAEDGLNQWAKRTGSFDAATPAKDACKASAAARVED